MSNFGVKTSCRMILSELSVSLGNVGSVDDYTFEVSIVIAAYNVSAHVERAIRSALAQTMPDIEILVVDDASTDDTAERVARLATSDPRIRLIRMSENGGPGHARNQALRSARGRWIAVLDADDFWVPTRLRRLLDASDDCDLVFDNLMGFDLHAGHATGPIFPLLPPAGLTLEDLLAPTAPGTTYDFGYLQPLMRTAFLREHNIAYVPELRANEDLVLSVTALIARARTATVPDALYIYTTPVGGQSGRPSSASKTIPGVSPVCRVLLEVMERNAGVLTAAERAAFTLRLNHIAALGAIALFRHAHLRRDYIRLLRILATRPDVRHYLWHRIRLELARRARGSRRSALVGGDRRP